MIEVVKKTKRLDHLAKRFIVNLFEWQIGMNGSNSCALVGTYLCSQIYQTQQPTMLKIFRDLEKHGVGDVDADDNFVVNDDFMNFCMTLKPLRKDKETRYRTLLGKFINRQYRAEMAIAREYSLNVRITEIPTLFDDVVKMDLKPADKDAAVWLKLAA